MTDTFYIGAYWRQRKQLLNEIIEPSLATLKGLAELDEQFKSLYELGMNRKKALEHKVTITPENIQRLFLERSTRNDIDQKGYNKIGFRLSVWTGQNDYEASNISLNVGSSSERLVNRCLISIPTEGIARNRLLELDNVKKILQLIITVWKPDYAVLNSENLSETLGTMNELGWVTYTRKLGKKLKLSNNVVQESNYLDGHLFHLKAQNGCAYNYELIKELLPLRKALIA